MGCGNGMTWWRFCSTSSLENFVLILFLETGSPGSGSFLWGILGRVLGGFWEAFGKFF